LGVQSVAEPADFFGEGGDLAGRLGLVARSSEKRSMNQDARGAVTRPASAMPPTIDVMAIRRP
jgi:hypothetical protein